MSFIALKMLVGDRGKYLALVVGLSFAVLLISQQAAIFLGLIQRSTGVLQNTAQPDLWIADPNIQFISDVRPLADRELDRVRSVPGIAWAEPFFSSRALVELPNGAYKTAQLVGVARSTMVGQPPEILQGTLDDLRAPDAVFVDESSRSKLGNVGIGDTLRLNDKRAVIVGICRVKLSFDSNAIVYTTFDNIQRYTPLGRERISYILAGLKPGTDVKTVQAEINALGEVQAFTQDEIRWRSVRFILRETGIGINFGITVLLGFVVGLAVVAAIFYQFTLENIRYFAVLNAMGARRRTLVRMVLLQAFVVGMIGYGIGVGGAGAFSLLGRRPGSELAVIFPWQLLVGSLGATLVCIMLGSLLSLRKVMTLEPAIVFK
ncbi:MAG TPA: ABC transporter permease [Phycisphaerales bacterium]|nr:ABC transporter permease [Phycisphaerales bacterium]